MQSNKKALCTGKTSIRVNDKLSSTSIMLMSLLRRALMLIIALRRLLRNNGEVLVLIHWLVCNFCYVA